LINGIELFDSPGGGWRWEMRKDGGWRDSRSEDSFCFKYVLVYCVSPITFYRFGLNCREEDGRRRRRRKGRKRNEKGYEVDEDNYIKVCERENRALIQ
jgi:hypothetical protein